jgi:hypothetical protein
MTTFREHKLVSDITFFKDMSKIGPGTEYHIFDLQQVELLANLGTYRLLIAY